MNWCCSVLLALCFEARTILAAVPANDNFNNAIVIDGTNALVAGANSGATREIGEPNHAANPGGRSVWWKWTAPALGSVEIRTQGSSFDTLLAAYTGTSVLNLNHVADNDDAGSLSTSVINFNVTAGTVYWIAVDGFDGAFGDIQLALDFHPGILQPPVNDNFEARSLLSGSNASATGTSFYATKEEGEPNHAYELGGASVWWSWTPPISGDVFISTRGSDFDTLLAVYTGTVLTNLALIASDDDVSTNDSTSAVSFPAVAGTIYQIAVDGFNASAGNVRLQIGMQDIVFLGLPELRLDAGFKLTVSGPIGKIYTVQSSDDLRRWTPLRTLTNFTGNLQYTDEFAPAVSRRFYRALQEP